MAPRQAGLVLCACALLSVLGCGEAGLSAKKKQELIETAKKDFLSGATGIADFPMAVAKMMTDTGPSSAGELKDITVTDARMLDYVDLPEDDAMWAVELDFAARDATTDQQRRGVAILQYGRHVVNGARKEADLMFSLTGYTKQDIENNRKVVTASLDAARGMRRFR